MMQHNRSRRLAVSALLMALSIIATRFLSIQTPIIRIGFGGVPIILAGLLYGPAWGFLVGVMADLIGVFGFPAGYGYFPGFTLTSGLMGTIAPLILGKKRLQSSFWALFGAIAISQVITSLVLDTYWVVILTGRAAAVLLPVRMLNQALMIPIWSSLVFALRGAVNRYLPSVATSREPKLS